MTATGAISRSKSLFRDMLANTTAFQTWDGHSYSVAQAKARIYIDSLPLSRTGEDLTDAEVKAMMPYALIYKPSNRGVRYSKDASPNGFAKYGEIDALFIRLVPPATASDPARVDEDFENFLGTLIQSGDDNAPGLVELSKLEGYLTIHEMSEFGPIRASEEEAATQGDWQAYRLNVRWGTMHGGRR